MLDWWNCPACSIPNDDAYSICVSCGTSRRKAIIVSHNAVQGTTSRSGNGAGARRLNASPMRRIHSLDAPEPEPQPSMSMHHAHKYSNDASARMVGLADRLISKLQPAAESSSPPPTITSSSSSTFLPGGEYDNPGKSPRRQSKDVSISNTSTTPPWHYHSQNLERDRVIGQAVDRDIAAARIQISLNPQQHRDELAEMSPIQHYRLGSRAASVELSGAVDRRNMSSGTPLRSSPPSTSGELAQMRLQLVESRLELLSVTDDRDRMMAELSHRCVAVQAQADKWRLEALSAKDETARSQSLHEAREAALCEQLDAERASHWNHVPHVVVDELRVRSDTAIEARGDVLETLTAVLRILCDETGPLAEGKRFSASVESFAMARSSAITELKERIAALEMQLTKEATESAELRRENARLQMKVEELSGHVQLQQVLASTREHKLLQEVQLLRHECKPSSLSPARQPPDS